MDEILGTHNVRSLLTQSGSRNVSSAASSAASFLSASQRRVSLCAVITLQPLGTAACFSNCARGWIRMGTAVATVVYSPVNQSIALESCRALDL